ncbi:hypothetical protein M407DRAFT_11444 [Tulasnella calospora MUT 4182]|uniref:Uncharacterized protein n=1 Tax=Tulasnella calospora MUT 4182 TaxID=1051891 RepID=A0A0C3KD63_9AGAM|nr:hypothetical protein M407DRAFT_11444 [Tulasnella calospora MUT 4182]
MFAVSSTSETHYPELWSLDHNNIAQSGSSQEKRLVDEYQQMISKRIVEEWECNVVLDKGHKFPTKKQMLEIWGLKISASLILLGWEGLKPRVVEWNACSEALKENRLERKPAASLFALEAPVHSTQGPIPLQVSCWLDPGMGEYHSKAHGAVKLGTATEYIWSDMPKSPNKLIEDHKTAFAELMTSLQLTCTLSDALGAVGSRLKGGNCMNLMVTAQQTYQMLANMLVPLDMKYPFQMSSSIIADSVSSSVGLNPAGLAGQVATESGLTEAEWKLVTVVCFILLLLQVLCKDRSSSKVQIRQDTICAICSKCWVISEINGEWKSGRTVSAPTAQSMGRSALKGSANGTLRQSRASDW